MIREVLQWSALLAGLAAAGLCPATACSAQDSETSQNGAGASSGSGWYIVNVPQLKPLWTAQAILNPSRDGVAFFSNDEDVVYVQSSAGTVTAFNAESGRELWAAQIGRTDEVSLRATSDDKRVIISAGPVVYGLDKFTGQRLFSFRLPDVPRGGSLLTNSAVLVPSGGGTVTGFRLSTLLHYGRMNALPPNEAQAHAWRYVSGEHIDFPPVAGRSRAAVVTSAGNIHAISLENATLGQTQFQFLMKSPATAPLTLAIRDDRELLLAVSADRRLFCIELQTNGVMRWTAPLSKAVFQPVIAVDNDVFVLAEDGELSKWDLLTGRPAEVPAGTRCLVSREEEKSDSLPPYGAAIEVQLSGDPAFHPIHIFNKSTEHRVSVVVLNLTTARSNLSFATVADGQPATRFVGGQNETGFRSAELSPDQRQLTLRFDDFDPNEAFSLSVDLSHPERKAFEIRESDLAGARVDAVVTTSSSSPAAGNRIFGEFRTGQTRWKVNRVKSLVAVTDRAVYFTDEAGRLAAVNRGSATRLTEAATPGYSLHISNSLTDRVYLGTTSGQIACFAEARVQLGVLALPIGGALTFVIAPESLLPADFAKFHQHPGNQPIMPEVSATGGDSAVPAAQ